VIVVGWFLGGSLGVQAGSAYRGAFDITLILLIASYFVLTQLHEQIFLFTSTAASDAELEAMCRPAALRISYMPQPAHRWMRAGLLDRPWRKVVFINAIDYERMTRDELKALVAHEMVHLEQHHDLLFGVQLRLLLVGAALLYWTLDLFRLLPALPNLGTAQSLVILLGVIFLGLFVLPYGQGRVAERRAYLGAAATVGAAPVLRVLRADSVRHPSWVRQVMSELERQADAEARARADDRPR
jgi:Zn-dependent protease with chaperone function